MPPPLQRRVLITGGAGFIGTHLRKRLTDEGSTSVFLYDNLLPQVHGETKPVLAAHETLCVGGIEDADRFNEFFDEAQPDTIFHLASETGTGQSMDEPRRYCDVNVTGTAILMEAMRRNPQPRHIVLSSSRSIYGEGAYKLSDGRIVTAPTRSIEAMTTGDFRIKSINGLEAEPIPTPETIEPAPVSVYASSKLVQEHLVQQLAPLAGATHSILRFQNVYGPGQSLSNPYTGVLSIFIDILQRGGGLNIFEDGDIVRDFVYVGDVVDAMLLAARKPTSSGPFNIGTGRTASILDVAHILVQQLGLPSDKIRISGDFRPGDVRYAVADIAKAQTVLGWQPATTLEEGLTRLVQWAGEQKK